MPRHTDDQRRNERRGRKDARLPAALMGYSTPGGAPVAVQGDEEAPYSHVPPFPTPVERLVDSVAPLFGDQVPYAQSDEIDVEWERILTLFVRFSTVNGATKLSLVVEVLDEKADEWFPLPVLGNTITPITTPVGGGSRDLMAAELRSPTIAAGATFRVAVSFDVAPFRKARVRYAELASSTSNNNIIIDITTSE